MEDVCSVACLQRDRNRVWGAQAFRRLSETSFPLPFETFASAFDTVLELGRDKLDLATCEPKKAALQKGMNFGVGKKYSIFLMSLRE